MDVENKHPLQPAIEALNDFLKGVMIANMVDAVTMVGEYPELVELIYNLKDDTVDNVSRAVPTVQQTVLSYVFKNAVEKQKEQEEKTSLFSGISKNLCN
jgi:hypothetical protein